MFLGASAASVEPQTYSETVLGVDSLIEFNLAEGVGYGVIRWIGVVPDRKDTMCGLELVSLTKTISESVWTFSSGRRVWERGKG